MAVGIGIDIENVDRFKRVIRNKNFLKRVYTPTEISYCRSKKHAAQHFAVRFAAKEAVWKAMSDVADLKKRPLSHRDIGLFNRPSGKPSIRLSGSYASWSKRLIVSLSHTRETVVAVALLGA